MIGRGLLLATLFLANSLILLIPTQAVAADPGCASPPDLSIPRPLPAAARGLQRGTLRILALGSGSVTGPGSSSPEAAWPARLQAILSERYPGRTIDVAVRGGRGVSVADHVALLREASPADWPNLVLWQAGTVEAVRGQDPDEMTEIMRTGLERIRRHGGDAIIMDQQFSRFLRANSNIEPYRDQLRLIAASTGAPFFPRYELMQHWVEAGVIDLERTPRSQRAVAIDRLNDCLAHALAALIVQGISEAR